MKVMTACDEPRTHTGTSLARCGGYTRGTDLSGSLEGAGGIGGLLARSHGYSGGNWGTHNFYHADGNGNITYLVTSAQGLAASYRYDPYGNIISESGTLSADNVYRFSSKEYVLTTAEYYYGYRWYNPYLQRWLNRDPEEEIGGVNLYTFVANSPLLYTDPYGLTVCHANEISVDTFWRDEEPVSISKITVEELCSIDGEKQGIGSDGMPVQLCHYTCVPIKTVTTKTYIGQKQYEKCKDENGIYTDRETGQKRIKPGSEKKETKTTKGKPRDAGWSPCPKCLLA